MNEKHVTINLTPLWYLTLLFIGLKLGKVITWTWPWVLAPLWIPVVLVCVIVFLIALFKSDKSKQRYRR